MTLNQQLKDPVFRKWMQRVPKNTGRMPAKNWYVYLRETPDSNWTRKQFALYNDALRYLLEHRKDTYDQALNSKARMYPPPKIRNKKGNIKFKKPVAPIGHKWCPYCRRMTLFQWFSKHPATVKYMSPYDARCSICAFREDSIPRHMR